MECLKYLEQYAESPNEILFILKDYPSAKTHGNKIVQELYEYLFGKPINLTQITKLEELTYVVNI